MRKSLEKIMEKIKLETLIIDILDDLHTQKDL